VQSGASDCQWCHKVYRCRFTVRCKWLSVMTQSVQVSVHKSDKMYWAVLLYVSSVTLQCKWGYKPWSQQCHSDIFITYLCPLHLALCCRPYTDKYLYSHSTSAASHVHTKLHDEHLLFVYLSEIALLSCRVSVCKIALLSCCVSVCLSGSLCISLYTDSQLCRHRRLLMKDNLSSVTHSCYWWVLWENTKSWKNCWNWNS